MAEPSARARAIAAWAADGRDPPDWVLAVADACDAATQAAVAGRLGYVPAVISGVLRRSYPGSLAKVEARVRQKLMAQTRQCPGHGIEITAERCREEQARPASTTSHAAVRFFQACRACHHNHQKRGSHAQ